MDSTIVVALIAAGASVLTGIITLVGVILNSRQQSRDIDHKLDKQQAVTNTKLDELTREVREHNNFAKRVPVLEEQMKVANHRIQDLEEFHKHP